MTDIEAKALALVNASSDEWYQRCTEANVYELYGALYRAIEQHEAFKQEVSDAVEKYDNCIPNRFRRFIIPKPKPDPLVQVAEKLGWIDADELRAALDALGFEIREKNDD